MNLKVLVVDDTALFRRLVSEAVATLPGMEVVGTASNGKVAMSRMASLKPDLVILDIEMPEMNGIEVLQAMAASRMKTGVIVLSSTTVRGGQITIRALELGAFDFLTKPDGNSAQENLKLLAHRLQPIIRAFERHRDGRFLLNNAHPNNAHDPKRHEPAAIPPPVAYRKMPSGLPPQRHGTPIVLIGVSTGGPNALAEVLPELPRQLGAPIFIVQHMPPLFTNALAERLDSKSAIRVKEAEDREIAVADCAYIAPGGKHMKIMPGHNGEMTICLTEDPPENNCRPSVDYLFRSVALNFSCRSVAAVLTGMGQDGTEGLKSLKRGDCSSIAQDEASCIVFGMPKEAISAGVVDFVVPLKRVAETIVHCLTGVLARSGAET